MSPGTSAPFCSTLLFFGVFMFVSAEQKNMTAVPGQKVTLTCRAPDSNNILVKWSRADLGSEYVLLYRDDGFVPDDQHESFKNRVDLEDRQMKDGDVSVILKNVTTADEGKYECHIIQKEKEKDGFTLISSIYLRVVDPPPGPTGGTTEDGGKEDGAPVGLIVGPSVAAVLLLAAAVGFLFYRRCNQKASE